MGSYHSKSSIFALVATLVLVVVFSPLSAKGDLSQSATAAGPGTGKIKVVWHADFSDPRRFSAMLTSIFNMVNTYEQSLQEYDVRIVLNAHGIRFLTDDKLKGTPFAEGQALKERRTDLKNRLISLRDNYAVKVELCEITREQIGLDRKKLYPGVQAVRSGVVRVAELQSQGFAYLKAE